MVVYCVRQGGCVLGSTGWLCIGFDRVVVYCVRLWLKLTDVSPCRQAGSHERYCDIDVALLTVV